MLTSVSFHAKIALVYACLFTLYLMLGWMPATVLVAVALLILGEVNRVKFGATGQPLVFHDIYEFYNALGLKGYFSSRLRNLLVIFFGVILTLFLRSFFAKPKKDAFRKRGIKAIGAFSASVVLWPFSLYPAFMGDLIGNIDSNKFYRQFDIFRVHADEGKNFQQNGLLMHLVMSSQTRPVEYYSPEDVSEDVESIVSGISFSSAPSPLPKKIIFVLCESCWRAPHEKSNIFSAEESQAVKNFRMLSPVYGGGTPNAELEVLTGLPARGLSGIIYQEYGARFSEKSTTLASMLKKVGYESLAMHNFDKKMWRRDVIYPRFGFDRFLSIGEMDYRPQGGYPPDSVIYASAKKALAENPEGRQFLFLITMYSHGSYADQDGDNGYSDFKNRLEKAEGDLNDFRQHLVEKYGSDYLMVVFADHRPGLAAHFFHSGDLPREVFDKVGVKEEEFQFSGRALDYWNVLGDVPIAVMGSDVGKEAYQALNGKPLYCLSPVIFADSLVLQNPVWKAMLANCQGYGDSYPDHYKKYPKSFYYNALFR